MRVPTFFLFVLTYTRCTLSNTTTERSSDLQEMEYKEGASVEATYILPQVKVSVSGEIAPTTVTASLARVLNFYNTELLAAHWPRLKDAVSVGCRRDVGSYLEGLGRADNWALKSEWCHLYLLDGFTFGPGSNNFGFSSNVRGLLILNT